MRSSDEAKRIQLQGEVDILRARLAQQERDLIELKTRGSHDISSSRDRERSRVKQLELQLKEMTDKASIREKELRELKEEGSMLRRQLDNQGDAWLQQPPLGLWYMLLSCLQQ